MVLVGINSYCDYSSYLVFHEGEKVGFLVF